MELLQHSLQDSLDEGSVNLDFTHHDLHRLPDDVTGPLGATYLPLEELLPRCDYVSVHVNLSDETRGLINVAKVRDARASLNGAVNAAGAGAGDGL